MTSRQVALEFMKEASRIFLELLISFAYSCFAFFVMLSVVLILFSPGFLLFTLIAIPVSVVIGFPGLLLFGLPATLAAHHVGLKKRIYWVLMGLIISIPSTSLFNMILIQSGYSSGGLMMFLLAIPVGGLCGSLVHKRLYVSLGKA